MRGIFTVYIIIAVIPLSIISAQDSMLTANSTYSSNTYTYIGIGSAVVLTAVMIRYDQQIYDELYSWKTNNKLINKVSPIITDLGDGAFSIGVLGGFAGYGLIFNNRKSLEVAKVGAESFLFTGITVQLLKHLCGRERPSHSTRPGGFWHGPFAFFDKKRGHDRSIAAFDAFPSGHTTTIFALATTVSDFYTEPWVSYTCYSLATLTAVSRVTESTHWLSDCFVGAFIGYYGTKLIEKWNYGNTDLSVLPFANSEQYGLLFTIKL